MEAQIERFAPGFRDLVLARTVRTAAEAEAHNPNLLGGDVNGGAATLRQTVFRPVARWNPYRTPVDGVYLCSASTPPGGGVHGMCGVAAAEVALRERFVAAYAAAGEVASGDDGTGPSAVSRSSRYQASISSGHAAPELALGDDVAQPARMDPQCVRPRSRHHLDVVHVAGELVAPGVGAVRPVGSRDQAPDLALGCVEALLHGVPPCVLPGPGSPEPGLPPWSTAAVVADHGCTTRVLFQ